MHFTTTIVSALAMLMAGQAVAAAVAVPAENDLLVRAAEIATSRGTSISGAQGSM